MVLRELPNYRFLDLTRRQLIGQVGGGAVPPVLQSPGEQDTGPAVGTTSLGHLPVAL